MHGYKKLSFRNKWHIFPFFFNKKILKFKRTKWKKVKSKNFYSIKQYLLYKKKLIFFRFISFFNNINSLKKKIRKNNLLKKKTIKFIIKLKNFLISKKYKKLKKGLQSKLKIFYRRPLKEKTTYFFKCFKQFFFNFKFLRFSNKFHIRSRYFFKNMLLMKASVLRYYYGCFSTKFFKIKNYKKTFINDFSLTFVRPEFRLDIALWRLKFFNSPYTARFAYQQGLILVNNKIFFNKLNFKKLLNSGDTLLLKSVKYSYKQNKNTFSKQLYLPTIFELDYYTNSLVFLKNYSTLNYKDLNSLIKEPLCRYQFKNYISKL